MWLKLRSACRRRAREKRVKNEHREAIVHAKSRCMKSLLRFVSEQDCNVPDVAQVQAGAESRVRVSLVSGSRLNEAISNSEHLRWQVILLQKHVHFLENCVIFFFRRSDGYQDQVKR